LNLDGKRLYAERKGRAQHQSEVNNAEL